MVDESYVVRGTAVTVRSLVVPLRGYPVVSWPTTAPPTPPTTAPTGPPTTAPATTPPPAPTAVPVSLSVVSQLEQPATATTIANAAAVLPVSINFIGFLHRIFGRVDYRSADCRGYGATLRSALARSSRTDARTGVGNRRNVQVGDCQPRR